MTGMRTTTHPLNEDRDASTAEMEDKIRAMENQIAQINHTNRDILSAIAELSGAVKAQNQPPPPQAYPPIQIVPPPTITP